jgi:xylono-1,5-lactonase
MPEAIGSIAFRRGGGLVAGMRSGFYALDIDSGRREALFELGSDAPGLRFNDGKCDRAGRFWSGSVFAIYDTGSVGIPESEFG